MLERLYRCLLLAAQTDRYTSGLGRVVSKLVWVFLLLSVYPWMYTLIALDRTSFIKRRMNPFVGFPRNTNELLANQKSFFRYLLSRNVVPKGSTLTSLEPLGGSDFEPEKSVSVLRAKLIFEAPGIRSGILVIFVKMATERPWPTWVRAFGATFDMISKEVGLFSEISPIILDPFPVPHPRCLCADWCRFFDRSIVVSECADTTQYRPTADHVGVTYAQTLLLVKTAAKLHARTWGASQSGRIPLFRTHFSERSGVDWVNSGLQMFIRKAPVHVQEVWKGIVKRCQRETLCLSHGDCRPGNMLWGQGGDKNGTHQVIFTDWEALSITPYLWDCTYAICACFDAEERKARERDVVQVYLNALAENDVPAHEVPSLEDAFALHRILCVVLTFWGWLITEVGAVGDTHGNTDADMKKWARNSFAAVVDAILEGGSDRPAFDIDVPKDLVDRFRKDYEERLEKLK